MCSLIRTDGLEFGGFIKYPDIEINKDEFLFIRGKSGCGKSTLLKLFNETLSPSRGKIYYKEKDIASLNTILLRQDVLLAGQNVYLFPKSITENFDLFYKNRGLLPPKLEEIERVLKVCQAEFTLESNCNLLSGGERQRIFQAIALSFHPVILMLDEPTSALDQITARIFLKEMKAYCQSQEITTVIVSHDNALIDSFAKRIITLA